MFLTHPLFDWLPAEIDYLNCLPGLENISDNLFGELMDCLIMKSTIRKTTYLQLAAVPAVVHVGCDGGSTSGDVGSERCLGLRKIVSHPPLMGVKK